MTDRWFRFYDGVLNDPKAQRLPPPLFKTWVNLLCLASQSGDGGRLPEQTSDIAFALRLNDDQCRSDLDALIKAGLLEIEAGTGREVIHNWHGRQYNKPSDAPESVAERVKRHREKAKETPPETPADSVTPLKRDCNAQETPHIRDREDSEKIREDLSLAGEDARAQDEISTAQSQALPEESGLLPKRKRLPPPTLTQAQEYFALKGHRPLADAFWNHFEACGWRMKSGPVTDWQAAARNWIAREPEFASSSARGRASPKSTTPVPVTDPYAHLRDKAAAKEAAAHAEVRTT